MLLSLQIDNIALIEHLEAEFSKGLNILSGETGAGKSIIIDSLNFVLGKRADKSLISYGKDSAKVSAFFDVKNCENALELLDEAGIDADDGELILQRTMTTDGKNVCRINGQKVTLAMLKEIAVALTDIYGQHEATGLLDDSNHIVILDKYAKSGLDAAKTTQQKLYSEYTSLKKQIEQYGSISDVARKLDTLQFELDEIEKADIKPGEEDELLAARKKFNNAQTITDSLSAAYSALDSDYGQGALSQIASAKSELNSVSSYDEEYSQLADRLDSVKIELKDIAMTLNSLLESSEYNPYEAEKCEQRLSLIRSIKRKYGSDEQAVLDYAEKLKEQLDFYNNAEFELEKLNKQLDKVSVDLKKNSALIHKIREEYANKLADLVTRQLHELGMANAVFSVNVSFDEDMFSAQGGDSVVFMFSANAGQPPKDLSKIISGGELSRFMLAVKNIISDIDGVQTMVFDEIDTGISGHIAQVVAQKLYLISKNKQVLAVTHLPQLAAMADNHFLISKSTENGKTRTNLLHLDREDSIGEVARLIGGSEYGSHAVPHAKEMKEYGDNFKKQSNL